MQLAPRCCRATAAHCRVALAALLCSCCASAARHRAQSLYLAGMSAESYQGPDGGQGCVKQGFAVLKDPSELTIMVLSSSTESRQMGRTGTHEYACGMLGTLSDVVGLRRTRRRRTAGAAILVAPRKGRDDDDSNFQFECLQRARQCQ